MALAVTASQGSSPRGQATTSHYSHPLLSWLLAGRDAVESAFFPTEPRGVDNAQQSSAGLPLWVLSACQCLCDYVKGWTESSAAGKDHTEQNCPLISCHNDAVQLWQALFPKDGPNSTSHSIFSFES